MARNFRELEARMTPARKRRILAQGKKMLRDILLGKVRVKQHARRK